MSGASTKKVRGFQSNPQLDEMLLSIEKKDGYQDRSETIRGLIRSRFFELTKNQEGEIL